MPRGTCARLPDDPPERCHNDMVIRAVPRSRHAGAERHGLHLRLRERRNRSENLHVPLGQRIRHFGCHLLHLQ